MKTKKILTLLFVLILTNTYCQNYSENNLIGHWKIQSYKIKGKLLKPTKEDKNDYIQFDKNNTFKASIIGDYECGRWYLNTNKDSLKIIDSDKVTFNANIIRLSKSDLALVFLDKKNTPVYFYYKKQKL